LLTEPLPRRNVLTLPGQITGVHTLGVPMFAFRDPDGNGMEIVEQR
jgi:catechol 2,3-dioxygenase-like lactoylglutathione lyase family enzyme